MNRFASASALLLGGLAATTPLAAQNGSVVSPAQYTNAEGDTNSYFFGRYPGGRYQNFDGEYRGTPMTLKGVAYRMDNYVHTTATAMGRTWTNVTINASECDMGNISNTFSKNPTTTPTLVYSGKVEWDSLIGKPQYLPDEWTISMPFQTNWAYSGKEDICLDYVFSGGTLKNGGTWNATTTSYFYLDGPYDPTYTRVSSTELGDSGNLKGCNDRSRTDLYGARLTTTCDVYSTAPANGARAGNMLFTQTGNYFGLSVPAIVVLGLRSIPGGANFPGVYCNKIYIDTSLPYLTFSLFTNSSGTIPSFDFGTGPNGAKFQAGLSGIELVSQAAWADKLNRRLMISSAASAVVPEQPPFFNRANLSYYDSARTTGSGPYWQAVYNPIARYTK